jgi:hypothetical protein
LEIGRLVPVQVGGDDRARVSGNVAHLASGSRERARAEERERLVAIGDVAVGRAAPAKDHKTKFY